MRPTRYYTALTKMISNDVPNGHSVNKLSSTLSELNGLGSHYVAPDKVIDDPGIYHIRILERKHAK